MSTRKATQRRPNIIQRFLDKVQTLFRETVGELRKVSWPTRQEAMNLTKIVLIVILAMAVFLGALDLAFGWLFAQLFGV